MQNPHPKTDLVQLGTYVLRAEVEVGSRSGDAAISDRSLDQSKNSIQSNLDISNSDNSNSAIIEGSI